MYVRMYVCMYVCMYVYMYVCMQFLHLAMAFGNSLTGYAKIFQLQRPTEWRKYQYFRYLIKPPKISLQNFLLYLASYMVSIAMPFLGR